MGIFAKRPRAGEVKTRLAAETSPAWAAEVAEAFLLDLLDRLAGYPCRRMLAYTPRCEAEYFAHVVKGRFQLSPQEDGDLGRRMAAFFEAQLQAGAERVVLLGTDSPTIPLEAVDAAFEKLAHADVVLGPAADGGYYLIGCASAVPPIFDGIRWGSPEVLVETVRRLSNSRLRLALLPVWHDVDTLADWRALRGYLAAARRAGVALELPRTAALAEPTGR